MSKKYSVKWVFNPDFEGCETCQDAGGQIYDSEPEGPHPNCECESVEVYVDEDDNIIDDIDETEEKDEVLVEVTVTTSKDADYTINGACVDASGTINSSEFESEFASELEIDDNVEYEHSDGNIYEGSLLIQNEDEDYNPEVTADWGMVQTIYWDKKVYSESGDDDDVEIMRITSNKVTIDFEGYSIEWN